MFLKKKRILFLIYGGLGNQLFQLAAAKNFLNNHDYKCYFVDMSGFFGRRKVDFELKRFGVKTTELNKIVKLSLYSFVSLHILINKKLSFFDKFFYTEKNIHTPYSMSRNLIGYGYWQGEVFFESVKKEFKFFLKDSVKKFGNYPNNRLNQTTAVHIRRGDYVNDKIANAYHHTADLDWYQSNMKLIEKNEKIVNFLIFSDDPIWCETNFANWNNVEIVKSNFDDSFYDMYLMSRCKNFILSNSSYSWWAEFLCDENEKITIAPEFWFVGVKTTDLPIFNRKWMIN